MTDDAVVVSGGPSSLAALVDASIDEVFSQSPVRVELAESLRVYAKAGKKVRSLSLLLWAAGHQPGIERSHDIRRAAAAVELAHRSTLISDDVVDNQDERNGHPTIAASAGRSLAVLAGPYLQAIALRACPDQYRDLLNEGIELTQAGQIRQQSQKYVSLAAALEDNRQIIALKASAIERAALCMAALALGLEQGEILTDLARALAEAYQTCNDIADLSNWLKGTTSTLPSDLQSKTYSTAVLAVLARCDPPDFETVLRYMNDNSSPTEENDLRAIFLKSNIGSNATEKIGDDLDRACRIVQDCVPSSAHSIAFQHYIRHIWKAQYLKTGAAS